MANGDNLSVVSSDPLPTSATQGLSVVNSSPLPVDQTHQSWWQNFKQKYLTPSTAQQAELEQFEKGTYGEGQKSVAQKVTEDVKGGQYAKAGHELISGVGAAYAPLAIPALAEAPVAFLTGIIGGTIGQKVTSKGAELMGANPDQAAFAGDIGAIGGGIASSFGASKFSNFVNAARGKITSLRPEQAVASRPAGALQPAFDNTPEEVLGYAQSKGIDLTPGEALQTPLAQTTQAIGERSLAQGGEIANAREVAAARLTASLKDLGTRSDPYGLGVSEEDAGRAVQQAIRVGQSVSRENASQAYKALPNELMNAKVDVSGINSEYFQAMKEAETSLSNRNPQMAAQIRQVYDQFSNLGTPATTAKGVPYKMPEVDFQTLLKMRSDALQDGDTLARAGAPTEVQGLYRRVAGELDDLAESTANKFKAADDWREANAGWREYQTKYNDPRSPLYQALNQSDPAKVTQAILNRGSASDIEMMKSENMGAAVEAIRRQVLTDVANRGFRVQGDGLGGYSDSFLKSLFGPGGSKELYLNGELARRMKFQLNPSGTSNVILGLEQATSPKALIGSALFGKAAMPRPAASYLPSSAPSRYMLPAGLLSAVTSTAGATGEQP